VAYNIEETTAQEANHNNTSNKYAYIYATPCLTMTSHNAILLTDECRQWTVILHVLQ